MIRLVKKVGRVCRLISSFARALILLAVAITTVLVTLNPRAKELPNPKLTPMPEPQSTDYSKFKHANPNHSRLPCLLCHRRESNASRPTLPGSNGHLPCAGCHTQQFASSSGPMCTICHTEAQSSKLKPFPRLSSFNMKFDHARHVRMGNVSCASCHRPSRGGVALSIPAGFNAHTTCFRCHTASAKSGEQNISSCAVCHQPGRHVRMRETAAAFRVGFSHAKHDKSEGLSCNECHRVRAGVARNLQVSAPQPLNHHASTNAFSCMSCHNGKKAFGGDDFSVCQRCHTGNAWHF
jgi:c(7)-type cytochrome triheme protein